MSIKLIGYPSVIPLAKYNSLKTKLVNELLLDNAILSVYQMGSVKHPGISDLDIICVFKNESQCYQNFRLSLDTDEKNILTHGLFGIEEKDLIESMSFNLISNLKHLGGQNLNLNDSEINTSDDIKKQIALEYLVKMLMTIDAQVTLKIIKLRAFLLLAKAIEFDLQLLNLKNGKLYDLVQKVIKYRSDWFTNKPSQKDITDLVLSFNTELRLFLEKELLVSKLYLPLERFELPGNFRIERSDSFSIVHKGLVLPNQFSFLGRKYINIQNRLNSFTYSFPFEFSSTSLIHRKRFQFSKEMVQANKLNFPHFISLTTSLSIY